MDNVLHIKDCYFRLPEDFTGSCGDALLLLDKRRLEQEKGQKVTNKTNDIDSLSDFWTSDEKCIISYCISTEAVFRAENERVKNEEPRNTKELV